MPTAQGHAHRTYSSHRVLPKVSGLALSSFLAFPTAEEDTPL